MSDITSRPYKPLMACDACVFGGWEHAEEFCEAKEGRMPIVHFLGGTHGKYALKMTPEEVQG